ncbi:type II toxin-antitoxin system death-on-curing family toxin [Nonomuraea roseoviolacea]|uniref:Death-on-curing protein n=1 Tax=Nonomuraea roseoviolacea subsp. carminata TaxID=160689 RepID=A0ABT1JTQ2_9ACTN|nr:type II toxin-antitoxin system death-on-curing family toxin [Nonomuraea roseoviolacea]MCP2345095.1 death-on-curing protein [Nonomuraea roseoviolacea subsp. carminata]
MTGYPITEDLFALAEEVLPEVRLRDGGQMHGAVLRPQTTVFGDDAYPDLWEKAAALMQSILIGHPLVDGNKRLAWTAAVAFLEDNGEILEYQDVDEAERLVIAVTTGELEDIPELAGRLRRLGA